MTLCKLSTASAYCCVLLLLYLVHCIEFCHGFLITEIPSTEMIKFSGLSSHDVSYRKFKTRRYSSTSSSTSRDQDGDKIRADIARMKDEAMRRIEALNKQFQEANLELQSIKETVPSPTPLPTMERKQEQQPQQNQFEKQPVLNSLVMGKEHANDARMKELTDMAEDFDREMQHQQPTEKALGIKQLRSAASSGSAASASKSASPFSTNDQETVTMAEIAATPTTSTATKQKEERNPLQLLDSTRWRLMLNIGREPGTWMPKTWGASGDRLYLNLELEFTNEQLYERDDFFNGIGGSKVLHVVHNEANMAPNMMEGGRRVRIKDGGWRAVPKEGPQGTTVLRFFFDLEEETRHQGSDVYLPSGRIYCTCGYFPMEGRSNAHGGESAREIFHKILHDLEVQYQDLQNEMDLDESFVSLEKLIRAKRMIEIRSEIAEISETIENERVREPEIALLRLSQDRSVGLTREGGVCCKKEKGVVIEYHIIGHFEIASMENREHSDYRELLP